MHSVTKHLPSDTTLAQIQKYLIRIFFIVLMAHILYLGYLYINQDHIVFPRRTERVDLSKTHLKTFHEEIVTTTDGEHVILWVSPPQGDHPTLLFFHGNGHTLNAPSLVSRFGTLAEQGFGVVALSYRGYGGSTGIPSEAGIKRDGLAAYTFAAQHFGEDHKIVAYGESLGTAVATYVASERPVSALIIQSGFSSLPEVAEIKYPFPAAYLTRNVFDSGRIIDRVHAPVLILHGQEDGLIPVAQAEKLYSTAHSPKRLVIFSQGLHGLQNPLPQIFSFLGAIQSHTLPPKEEFRISSP
jgi:pimeloyl-ACP methyl ester carboxylesterase